MQKKTFKEIHGKTRVGMFLKKNAPKLLDTIIEVVGGVIPGASGFADTIQGFIKNNPTGELNTENKELAAEYVDLELKKMEVDVVEMQELTKRLKSDNENGLTRLVRPLSYVFAWLILGFIMFFDGNVGHFTVDKIYIPLIQDLIKVMTIFYFGSRGVEKVVTQINKHKNK